MKWLDLLRLIYKRFSENDKENVDVNGRTKDNYLIDVDIFDDTEPNTFDETMYTCHKSYNFLVEHINNDSVFDSVKKQEILAEFETLQNI